MSFCPSGATSGRSPHSAFRSPRKGWVAPAPEGRPSIVLELQPQRGQLVADLVERGDAEVLALQELVAAPLHEVADRLDVELAHALAGPDREAQLADRLVQEGLDLGGHFLGRLDAMV